MKTKNKKVGRAEYVFEGLNVIAAEKKIKQRTKITKPLYSFY